MGKRKMLVYALITIILLALPGLYNGLKVRHYEIVSDKVETGIRLALVTDLHSCKYGENAEQLIEAIIKEKPDALLLGGDIFDDRMSPKNTEDFLRGITGLFPIYYVTGNHECRCTEESFEAKMAVIEESGIKRLRGGDTDTVEINGSFINICGVDDPDIYFREGAGIAYPESEDMENNIGAAYTGSFISQLNRAGEAVKNGYYSVILCHRPEIFNLYSETGFDLALCGHAHGGQWRIPGIMNGLIAPNQGLFPKYAGGLYDSGNTKMIVSRGLARENIIVPRIYNRPELVIVSISKE